MGLPESLMDSKVSSIQLEVLMKMGSVDLIVCQEGNKEIPYCQVGRDKQVRLCESLMNSEVSLDQQVQLTKEEDLRNLLMIEGIQIFFPLSPEEAKVCAADEAGTTGERKPAETVKEKLEQVFETTQAEKEEENEHSEEWLNILSQEAEKTVAFELAEEKGEEADNISLFDMYEQIEALERRVIVQGMHIQQVKLEADEEGMGDHSDLPNCRKFLQPRRLHEAEPATRAAGRSDREDQGDDVRVNRNCQQGEAEQKERSKQ
jgi:hypothetical protein